jgi:hypothetical protein
VHREWWENFDLEIRLRQPLLSRSNGLVSAYALAATFFGLSVCTSVEIPSLGCREYVCQSSDTTMPANVRGCLYLGPQSTGGPQASTIHPDDEASIIFKEWKVSRGTARRLKTRRNTWGCEGIVDTRMAEGSTRIPVPGGRLKVSGGMPFGRPGGSRCT